MSQRLFRKAKARRAVGVESSTDTLAANSATTDEDLSVKGLVAHGLAALAISALGLAVAGSVTLSSAAQAAEVSQTSTVVQGSADKTQAVPAVDSRRIAEEQAAANQERNAAQQAASDGQLDAFGRTADGASRNAVRNEIDRAVASQQANERGAALEETGDKAIETSANALADARNTNLQNQAAAAQREEARLAEEKRKAEEALQRQKDAAQADTLQQSHVDPEAPADGGGEAPKVDQPAAAGATTPMPKGRYSVGARWGAVGSWSRYHTGQDLSAPIGTPIHAVSNGVVGSSNAGGWAGVHAVIHHDSGSSLYAHMASMTVSPGQQVKAGDLIGYVGMTGRTFGPHLHFEFYPKGASTSDPYSSSDPYRWLVSLGVRM